MAWAGPTSAKPVWCATTGKTGPTAQSVSCVTKDPKEENPTIAMVEYPNSQGVARSQSGTKLNPHPLTGEGQTVSDVSQLPMSVPANYTKFTNQTELGRFLTEQYHIRPPNELSSCEVCHR